MPKALTAQSIERVKPDTTRRLEVPDGLLPEFYLVIQPSGSRSGAVRYRRAGKPCKLTLGPYPALAWERPVRGPGRPYELLLPAGTPEPRRRRLPGGPTRRDV